MSKGQKHRAAKITAEAKKSSLRLGANRQLREVAHEVMQDRKAGYDTDEFEAYESFQQPEGPRGPSIMR